MERGVIRFQRDGEEGHFRIGEIFCEDDFQGLGDRFSSFTAPTMSAFLRSTLPRAEFFAKNSIGIQINFRGIDSRKFPS